MGLANRLGNAQAGQQPDGGLFNPKLEGPHTHFGAKVVDLGIEFCDPRPDLDLEYNDGGQWAQLFALAHRENPILCGTLHGFRCQGTRLIKNSKGNGYVIRPVIGKEAWKNQGHYKHDRDYYLKQFEPVIVRLLGQLIDWAKEHTPSPNGGGEVNG